MNTYNFANQCYKAQELVEYQTISHLLGLKNIKNKVLTEEWKRAVRCGTVATFVDMYIDRSTGLPKRYVYKLEHAERFSYVVDRTNENVEIGCVFLRDQLPRLKRNQHLIKDAHKVLDNLKKEDIHSRNFRKIEELEEDLLMITMTRPRSSA
jgi:hypothetical protein